MKQVNCNISIVGGGPLPGSTPVCVVATCDLDPIDSKVPYGGVMGGDGRIAIQFADCAPTGGANVSIIAAGFKPTTGRINVPAEPGSYENEVPPATNFAVEVGPNPFA